MGVDVGNAWEGNITVPVTGSMGFKNPLKAL